MATQIEVDEPEDSSRDGTTGQVVRPRPDNAAEPERIVRETLPRFGFAPTDIDGVYRLPQRVKNVNFKVQAGGADWVLKHFPPQQNTERLRCTHALELQLADAGFPVAQLQHSTDGQTFIGDRTGYYSLHAWVKGRQISIDERERTLAEHSDLVIDLGRLIGRFHRLTAAMTTPDSIPSIEVDRMLMAPKGTARSIRRGRPPRVFKAHQLRFRLRKSEFDWWILDHLPTLYQQAERLAEMSTDGILRASDIVVAHHDVNWENLIFGEDFEPLALLDFDNAVRLQRDIDVGLAAAVLIGPNAERLQSFLSSYADAAQHHVDSSMVAVGMQVKCARSILWSIDSYLSGRVADPTMIATWCAHLYECLELTSA